MGEEIRNALILFGVFVTILASAAVVAINGVASAIDRHANVMRSIRDDDIDH